MARENWLFTEHPIYTARKEEWTTNERRFRGGFGVLAELKRFDWEAGAPGLSTFDRSQEAATQAQVEAQLQAGTARSHYADRQRSATYINFPESFAGLLLGHLMRQAPVKDQALNFGTLGTVQRPPGRTTPSRAELVYYNADGVGNDGSHWDSFWTQVGKWAMATGHRWLMVEAPRERPTSLADELRGRRPYLRHFSPLDVPNWHFVEGRLAWVLIKIRFRQPQVNSGRLAGNEVAEGRRLLVAKGVTALGSEYQNGGWWEFDKEGVPLEGRSGAWENTRGDIPAWIHYYERDDDQVSRSGTFEMGQAAVAHMNMASAADYDAWDAAQSVTFVLGADAAGFNLAADKLAAGSRLIPVPINEFAKTAPQIYDGSTGSVAAGVFTARLEATRALVRELASLESSGGPDASGLAKQMGFLDAKSPRLRLLASEFESSQNTALHFLEQRFNGVAEPTGAVAWPRDFDLAPLLEQIDQFLELQSKAGVTSSILTARSLRRVAEEVGLISDTKESEQIETGIRIAIEAEAAQRARDAAGSIDQLPGDGEGTGAPGGPGLVLNGAQIAAAKEIVLAVTAGDLTRDTGLRMLSRFFNLTEAQAAEVLGSAGTGTPTTPNPKPVSDSAAA